MIFFIDQFLFHGAACLLQASGCPAASLQPSTLFTFLLL